MHQAIPKLRGQHACILQAEIKPDRGLNRGDNEVCDESRGTNKLFSVNAKLNKGFYYSYKARK
jgi:hypothetical protein